jgi:hypothetical protein
MTAVDRDANLRARARRYVDERLDDDEIAQKIRYDDESWRDVIWTYVEEFRAELVEQPNARLDLTPEEVRAERARRSAAGEDAGYDSLARHFHVHPTTIRRRLGKL